MNTPNTPARFLVATLGVFLTASGCATLFGPRELAGSGEGAPAAPQPVAVPEPVRQLQAISAAATPTLATKAVRTYFGDIEAGRLVLPLDLRTEIDRALADYPYPRVQAARRRIVGRFTDEALLLELPGSLPALEGYLAVLDDQQLTARVEGDEPKAQAIAARHQRLYRLQALLEDEIGSNGR